MDKPLMLSINALKTRQEVTEHLDQVRYRLSKWDSVLSEYEHYKRENAMRHARFRTAVRNYNALRGVEATLMWFLGLRDSPDY